MFANATPRQRICNPKHAHPHQEACGTNRGHAAFIMCVGPIENAESRSMKSIETNVRVVGASPVGCAASSVLAQAGVSGSFCQRHFDGVAETKSRLVSKSQRERGSLLLPSATQVPDDS
jgi:hypothetical protein